MSCASRASGRDAADCAIAIDGRNSEALYIKSLLLADALVAAGKPEEAKAHYAAAMSLAPDTPFAKRIALSAANKTGDIAPLLDPGTPMPAERRAAMLAGMRALTSGDAGAMAGAIKRLVELPEDQQNDGVARLLAQLGNTHAAFQIAARLAAQDFPGPAIF